MKKYILLLVLFTLLGSCGCATLSRQNAGYYDANRLWLDDISFQNDPEKNVSDWQILDLDPDSMSHLDRSMEEMGSDLFDVIQ